MGRSGRGGGGGGRSGGFSGGSRRSGGFSGGSRGGFSGGHRSGGSSFHRPSGGGWGFRPPRRPSVGPIFVNTGNIGGSRRSFGGGGGSSSGSNNSGCISVGIVLVFIVFLFVLFQTIGGGGSGNSITKSTVEREPLPAGAVVETDYYTDELGWITNSSALTQGMKEFYERTGVQPYLYLVDSIDGDRSLTTQQLSDYSETLYDSLFEDEAHFLLVFHEYGNSYNCGYTVGAQAKAIMDDEAITILADYLDQYYYSDLNDEEFFSTTFAKTAERIMSVTRSPLPIILIVVGVIVVVILLFYWWKAAKAQKNKEDEKLKEILETPLETFEDQELEDLEEKYADPTSGEKTEE